jgi:hypothetical protein
MNSQLRNQLGIFHQMVSGADVRRRKNFCASERIRPGILYARNTNRGFSRVGESVWYSALRRVQ